MNRYYLVRNHAAETEAVVIVPGDSEEAYSPNPRYSIPDKTDAKHFKQRIREKANVELIELEDPTRQNTFIAGGNGRP